MPHDCLVSTRNLGVILMVERYESSRLYTDLPALPSLPASSSSSPWQRRRPGGPSPDALHTMPHLCPSGAGVPSSASHRELLAGFCAAGRHPGVSSGGQ